MTPGACLLDVLACSATAGVLGYGLGVLRHRRWIRRGGGEWLDGYLTGFEEGHQGGERSGYERGRRDARASRGRRVDRGEGGVV